MESKGRQKTKKGMRKTEEANSEEEKPLHEEEGEAFWDRLEAYVKERIKNGRHSTRKAQDENTNKKGE